MRTWKRDCYRCNKSTEIVTYILDQNEFGCVIGSHAEIDEILKTKYPLYLPKLNSQSKYEMSLLIAF